MAPIATHPRLRVRQEDPLNAEPAPDALIESFRTPNELFFIRGHGNIPAVDAGAFRLTVDGLVESPLSLSLVDLRRLPRRTAGALIPPFEHHVLANACPDRASLTLHVYGGEMTHCDIFQPEASGMYRRCSRQLSYDE
jgi:hypothetical protein